MWCVINKSWVFKITLQSFLSVPELLQFVEIFVENENFGYGAGTRRGGHSSAQKLLRNLSTGVATSLSNRHFISLEGHFTRHFTAA